MGQVANTGLAPRGRPSVTRRLRPPQSIRVWITPNGLPAELLASGARRAVTHVCRTWIQHALVDATGTLPGDKRYYRVIVDGQVPWDIYCDGRGWYLERVIG
jgi:hypothetical protein